MIKNNSRSMSVQYLARKASNGYVTIYARIEVNGDRGTPFSTGIRCLEKHWNGDMINHKHASADNEELAIIRNEVKMVYLEMRKFRMSITPVTLRERWEKFVEIKSISLLGVWKEWIKMKGKVLKANTLYNIERRCLRFQEFLKETGASDMDVNKVTRPWADTFINWMRKHKYSVNYIAKLVEELKAVVAFSVDKGYLYVNPLLGLKYSRTTDAERVYISSDELEAITKMKFFRKRLQRTADLLVFSCRTGLSYADLMDFDYEKHLHYIGNQACIKKKRVKSKVEFIVPIDSVAMKILNSYDYKLPKIGNSGYNMNLKILAEVMGIRKNLTTHVGRRTFSMVQYQQGVRRQTIARMLGHKSERTTDTYYLDMLQISIEAELDLILSA
ncbi:phage integrase SAM-like domain-containing protein [Limibacter armeniacum]|uniref:site-specific integrase n=1 Tax=Limibacter armeniacum TaxID=466084 RepID=UPI002FE52ED9